MKRSWTPIGGMVTTLPALFAGGCFLITAADIEERTQAEQILEEALSDLQVFVHAAGRPISGATVTAAEQVAVTDGSGTVWLRSLVQGSTPVTIQADGYTTGHVHITGSAGTAMAQVDLRPLSERIIHRAENGGAISELDTFSLVFREGSFENDAGGSPTGPVVVRYAWLEGGPAMNADVDNPLELVAFTYLDGASGSGGELTLVAPADFRIRVDAGSPIRDLPGLAAYWFDPTLASWVNKGEIEQESSYLLATGVDAFGWWAIGAPTAGMGCVTGQLVDNSGTPISGGEVRLVDADWAGFSRARPDNKGHFCMPARLASSATLSATAYDASQTTLYAITQPLDQLLFAGQCPEGCQDLGTITAEEFPDSDGDGFAANAGGDCNDEVAGIYPGAVDVSGDGTDQNCDGVDGADNDRDGYADDDCDDDDPSAFPGGQEQCDGVDNNCNGQIDEQTPNSVPDPTGARCLDCGPQPVVDLGPLLYWRLEDEGTLALDSSGWGHDGEISGLAERYPGITHNEALAPTFGGVIREHVRLADVDRWPTDEISVSIWWKTNHRLRSLVSYAVDESDEEGPIANEFKVFLHQVFVRLGVDEVLLDLVDTTLPLGAWQHAVVTWETSGAVKFYSNNALLQEETLHDSTLADTAVPPDVQTTMSPGGVLYLGQEMDCHDGCFTSWQAFDGLIDEVAIFDRVLTRDEVAILYNTATCGEGVLCNGLDDDGDGVTDEHLIGTEACPATDCVEILDNGASIGDGSYWFEGDSGATEGFCDMTAGGITSVCGDGEVSPPFETCDDNSPTCNACAKIVVASDCADALRLGETTDGPYMLDLDGFGGPLPPQRLRCDMNKHDGGWTLVHGLNTEFGYVFLTEEEVLESNLDDPFHPQYSILGLLDELRGLRGFEFRLTWPSDPGGKENVWRQRTNPVDDTRVDGYEAIAVDAQSHGWQGLERASGGKKNPTPSEGALIDGTEDGSLWYAVGLYKTGLAQDNLYLIPATTDLGGDGTASQVQLWARPSGVL